MDLFHTVKVFFIFDGCDSRVGNKKGIMSISSRMGLRLKERIEIPEGTLYVLIGLHFLESHLDEDFYELLPSLHKQMQVTILYVESLGLRIEFLEGFGLPRTIVDHFAC